MSKPSSKKTPASTFKRGDRVTWNSEAGRVTGIVQKKITAEIVWKGYRRHASKAEPQYIIKTEDAHDNCTLAIDESGHLLVFGNAHGRTRPAYVFRSVKPYSIDAFDEVWKGNFSYGDPWVIPGVGVLLLHTHYEKGNDHNLFFSLSPDGGKTWPEPSRFATFGHGHYQISWSDPRDPRRVGTAFDFHPNGLDSRTNLYYLETSDGGRTWQSVGGQKVQPPLLEKDNPALVTDFQSQKLNVYLKDLQFDGEGHPVITD